MCLFEITGRTGKDMFTGIPNTVYVLLYEYRLIGTRTVGAVVCMLACAANAPLGVPGYVLYCHAFSYCLPVIVHHLKCQWNIKARGFTKSELGHPCSSGLCLRSRSCAIRVYGGLA